VTLSTAERVIILDIDEIRADKSIYKYFHIEDIADLSQNRYTPVVDPGGYVVYTCKMPAVVEGEGKLRVRSLKINDGICQRISAK
jgi:hypothetical protein